MNKEDDRLKFIKNESNDPRYNLAFEEYCFKNLDQNEDYVILWINGPTIVVGKNQNTAEEVNSAYVKENNIHVVRRITGGGAVYHDLGNLNFSFLVNSDQAKVIDFHKYNIPILKALEKIGIEAELSGRNDITIDGKKFSGIAQSIWRDRVLNHGTLLFDSDLQVLSQALNVREDKIQSKGIKSVKSRVTNIKSYVKEDIDVIQFRDLLLEYIFQMNDQEVEEYVLSPQELAEIDKLFKEKYSTWEWNYGKSPSFNYKNYKRFPFGAVEVRLQIEKGLIKEAKIFGDFFGAENIEEIEEGLKNLNYQDEAIKSYLEEIDLGKYFGSISQEDFLSLIFD